MKPKSLKINFLETDAERKARRTTLAAAGLFTLLVGILAMAGAGASYRAATRGTNVLREFGGLLTLTEIRQFVWGGEAEAGDPFATPDGRLNVLLLGVGGEGHDGPQLTDTILFASVDRGGKRIGMVSVPRDMAYPLGGGRFQKINAVNAYAEQEYPGEGAKRTAEALSKLFSVRIDRVVRIDFKGFEDFIDALGGIDVTVEKSFVDREYPTGDDGPNDHKWTVLTFTKGPEHMDGKRALTYVRSRHGSNGEGSDFARSRRQQIVVEAVRSTLLSLGTLANPKRLTDIWTAVSSRVQTDLSAWDLLKLAPFASRMSDTTITTRVLTDAADGELIPSSVEGAFMLFPKKPDWSEVRSVMADPFESKEDLAKQLRPQERITVEVLNGTTRTGYATQASEKLAGLGYVVASTGNAARRGYERTVIYDLTDGAKSAELARLKKLLDANVSSSPPAGQGVLTDSGSREALAGTTTQFLIILGDSSLGLVNPYYVGPTNP